MNKSTYKLTSRPKEEQLKEQGRKHGQNQLRTGGQGRKCAYSHFLTRANGRTDGRADGRMDKNSYRVACPQLKK